MPTRMRPLLSPLFGALLLTLAAGPVAAQRAPAVPAACADFYGHANAAWLRQNPLPAGADAFSRWDQLNAQALGQRDQLLSASTAPANAVAARHLADLIASSQDEAAIEAAGADALKPLLERINKMRKPRDAAEVVAALHAAGVPVLLDFEVMRDAQGQPYAQLGPGGLGLPEAGFYTRAEPELRALDLRYRSTVSEWLRLTGTPGNKLAEQSSWVVSMEVELAKAALTGAPFQVMALQDAEKVTGALGLERFLAAQGLKATQVALVGPGFFQAVNRMLAKTKVEHWKAYLRAHLARELAPALSKDFREPWVQLYDVYLAGQAAPTPRLQWLQKALRVEAPEFVDAAFDERFLPAARRQRAESIAAAVRTSATAAIDRAPWLSAEGKAGARQRLADLDIQIGRSVPAEAFKDLRFDRGQLAGNVLALRRFLHQHSLQRARLAWPAEQWQPLVALMPQENRLVVTASLLQPPVLDDGGSAADYGSFGGLLAQQVALGLQAWDGTDASAWSQRSMPLIAQYNAYPATGGATRVNGTRSFAQNQADLAGLEIAWAALNAPGTPDANAAKAFFTGWAGLWQRQDKVTALAAAQATALHAPAKWRVNGPLANLPAFGLAFGCKGRVAMQRPAREQVALWR